MVKPAINPTDAYSTPAALQYFPLFFDLRLQKVLIVGGGEVALRKAALLERAGAAITLVAPRVVPEFERRAVAGTLTVVRREFVPEDLTGVRLAIVATGRRASNRWIASLCEARAIPVNVVDDREASRVIVPAIVDRDPVLIAISTAGASPVLARRLRERLEAFIPARIGELALWLSALRAASRRRLRGTAARRRYFETLVDGPAAARFIAGDVRGAEQLAQRLLAADAASAPAAGHVVLVGAGPGDPELLTLKALRALSDADVILYDRLVGEGVVDLARRDAVKICVGKSPGGAGAPQEWINDLLVEHARAGRRVVRLKGGDPFVFGRGGDARKRTGDDSLSGQGALGDERRGAIGRRAVLDELGDDAVEARESHVKHHRRPLRRERAPVGLGAAFAGVAGDQAHAL